MIKLISFGPFTLYPRERRLEHDGQAVKLGSRALDILIVLTERAGEIVSRDELVTRVWPDTAVEESGLRVHVAGLRKALGEGRDGARYVTNVPGRGYSFVAKLGRVEQLPQAPHVPARDQRSHNLPAKLSRIVGRDESIREVSERVLATRFVSVVGPGGMGKTTVAVAVAHALLAEFSDDVWFVELGSVADPRQAPVSIAATLGFAVHSDDAATGLSAFLRDRRILIVLDNCEHVLETVAPLAERISRDAKDVYILATSRESLRVAPEHVYRMTPLQSPAEGQTMTAAEALTFPAVQLFVERALAGGTRLSLNDVDAPVVADICRRLDGIALAIEVAAGRVDAYGVSGTASLLENRFKLLWHGRRTATPRHQTLRAMLDWSYNLLSELERTLLRAFSMFVGFFSLDAVAAMAGGVDADQAVDALGSLVDKSLVALDVGGSAGVRYRLLETTRAYVSTKLDEAHERDDVAARHASYMCTTLENESRVIQGKQASSLAEHLGNVRVALEWAFSEIGNAGIGTRLAAASAPMFMELSLLRECHRWSEAALAALDDADRESRREMELQAALGTAAMFTRGNTPEVREALDRGLSLADRVDDPQEQLRLLGAVHLLLTRTAEWRDALAAGQRAEIAAARLPNDPAARTSADWMIGTSVHLLGDQVEAEKRCRSVLNPSPISRSTAMLYFGFDHRIRALVALARSLWLLGRADDALRVARDTVRDAAEAGQPTTVAISLCWTSSVFVWSGELTTASEIIERLVRHCEKYSLGPYHAVGLGLRAELSIKRGEIDAVAALQHAMDTLHVGRHDLLRTVFATGIAEGLGLAGRLTDALTMIDQAIAMTEPNGSSFDLPEMLRIKGQLLMKMATPDEGAGEHCLLEALECAKRQGALGWELRAAMAIGRLWSSQKRADDARNLVQSTVASFTQGLETNDLHAARRLLAEL
jgi:predicted ATPase/DNA-binding winged helix-turn-helix (wHTH) protein